ncbi:MAG: GTPase [Desulfuromonadia bacterium]
MSFRTVLQQIVDSVGGGIGAVIMGYDGIAIEEYFATDVPFDLPLLSVEYANLLKDVRRTIDIMQGGAMEEVSFSTQKLLVVARPINDDFFLMLILEQGGNFGKARFLLRRESYDLREPLS